MLMDDPKTVWAKCMAIVIALQRKDFDFRTGDSDPVLRGWYVGNRTMALGPAKR